MSARARSAWLVSILIAPVLLTGCTTSVSCAGWHHFETPADLAKDARLVVIGESEDTGETVQLMGVQAAVHEITVAEVLKGELDEQTIRVASTPDACSGVEGTYYPQGDPLAVDGPAEFFIVFFDGVWRSPTPFQGAIPIPDDGNLPWDPDNPTPTPSPSATPTLSPTPTP